MNEPYQHRACLASGVGAHPRAMDVDRSKLEPWELAVLDRGGSYSSWGVRRKSPELSPADLAKQQRRKRKRNREAQRAYRERHSEAISAANRVKNALMRGHVEELATALHAALSDRGVKLLRKALRTRAPLHVSKPEQGF
jgi:hypothetical protein